MSKVKLTENQVAMIQQRVADLEKKKVLKVNEGQYDRLFKGGFNKASKTMSKDLKKGGIKENEETSELNPLEFAQELIVFIKDIIANPRRVPFSTYWDGLGITRKELFLLVKKEDLLTMMVDEGNVKTYKAKKVGFRKGIKELCKKIMENQLNELSEDGGYPAGAEFDSRAPYNQDDSGQKQRGELTTEEMPFKFVHFNERSDGLMIFKNGANLYAFNATNVPEEEYAEFMDMDSIVDDEAILRYVNAMYNPKTGSAKPQSDPEAMGAGQLVQIGPELKQLLISWYGADAKMVEILNRLPESTGAASSGAYVGAMSGGPIQKDTGMSPEQAMQDINEDMAVNQFLVTYNLDDNGGDTSPFFNEFHEVQEFMNKLEQEGTVTGVKVSKTDDKGQVAKEFTYDFDGQNWQKRNPVEETTSMGGAGGINTGRGGNSIEHDVNAFGDSSFMKAGNKLNKEEAMPMIKRQIGESMEAEKLTPMLQQAISSVDDSLGYQDFAIAVANVIKDSYGQHLINSFLKVLKSELGPSDIHLGEGISDPRNGFELEGEEKLNQEYLALTKRWLDATPGPERNQVGQEILDFGKENDLNIPRSLVLDENVQVGQVYSNGSGRARVDKILGPNNISITRWGDVSSNSVNIDPIQLGGWTLMEGKKVVKISESQLKRVLRSEKKK